MNNNPTRGGCGHCPYDETSCYELKRTGGICAYDGVFTEITYEDCEFRKFPANNIRKVVFGCANIDNEKCTVDGSDCYYLHNDDEHDCCDFNPTNADHIRNMTDEELAKWLCPLTDCVRCYARDNDDDYDMRPCYTGEMSCEKFWLKWLKKEVNDEVHSDKERI